ncbi:MAG: enoyl-CoA hydratase/isomerase family protein [Proteobacteria bacterium]|nr:MAG: enoyl-CoA hydratase/isomerase family protein [Pseudomonadota bacterium]
MAYESIRYEIADKIATITLNRPERHNAFTVAMAGELRRAWADVTRNPDVVVAIVTGAGEKAFCTGMDVADVADGSASEAAARMEREEGKPFYAFLTAIQNRCWKPVVTAVNGMVVGGGLHFVADSDLVVAAEHASFFDTHVKVGLVAGLEPVGLVRRIPLEQVLRMALLGGSERMTAQQALACGLVGEVVPREELLSRARELAAKIAEHSPTALARSKQAIWESLDVGLHEALGRTWRLIQAHTAHPDAAEGAKAFVEKRKPRWAPFTGE